MQKNSAFPLAARGRVVVFLMACLGLMVFAAVAYRVENPSIVQHEQPREMPGGGAMGQMGGDMAGVSVMMKKLQENPEDVDAMRSLGMSFMDMQAWDKALSFWEMILERNENDVMALNQKGFCLFELERYPEAAELFERMLAIEPHNYHAHYNLGVIYKYYLSKPENAATHFQAVIDAAPDDPGLMSNARRELEAK
ncbi:MAG: tetratricopeptide repeat protein [Desulfomicrobium sp.]